MLYSVDRLEDGAAVLVDEQGEELLLRELALPLREGMVVERTASGAFVPRGDLEDARRREANELLAGLLAKSSQPRKKD